MRQQVGRVLIDLLEGTEGPSLQRFAVPLAGQLKIPSAVDPLIAALHADDPDTGREAGRALGQLLRLSDELDLDGARIIEALIETLERESDHPRYWWVKTGALQGLWYSDCRAVPALLKVVRDEDNRLNQVAARSLYELMGPGQPHLEGMSHAEPSDWQAWWDQYQSNPQVEERCRIMFKGGQMSDARR
jgi:HEAT repeat protein